MEEKDSISAKEQKYHQGGRMPVSDSSLDHSEFGNNKPFQELRSEEVEDLLSNQPPWALRWGNTLFLVILLGMIGISFVVRYPEIIKAPFLLTSDDVPKAVVSKINGRLVKIFAKEGQFVNQGQVLGYMESTASHDEILSLEKSLDSLAILAQANLFDKIASFHAQNFTHLGELQNDYQTFIQQFTETATLFSLGYLNKKKNFLNYELSDLAQNHDQLLQQYELQSKDLNLAEREYQMHKKLYEQKVIAWVEYNREERNYLAKQMPVKQLEMSITNNMTAQTQKQKELAELEKQANDQKIRFSQALNTFKTAVSNWKTRYILVAPRSGNVMFASLWQEEQFIKADELLFHVGNRQEKYFGEAKIKQQNAGRIKINQKVLVKFQSYPFEQYGMVEGYIQQIASMPSSDSTFRAVIALPKGLITNAHKQLPFKNGLNASAEIITDDLSVAERLFYQLRKLLSHS